MGRQVAETPQGLESAERTRTGGIYTLDLGFRNRYEVCGGWGANPAGLPQARAPGWGSDCVGRPGAGGVQAAAWAAYLSLFPFHSRRPPARGARPPVRAAEIGGGGHVGGHVPRRAPSKRKWGLV